MKKKMILFALSFTLLGGTLGAVTTTKKITAELKGQNIVLSGSVQTQQIISYNGTTYVPLRSFANLVGTQVDYKNGNIYLGEQTTSTKPVTTKKYNFKVDGAEVSDSRGDQVAIVDISFTNNSGETQTPLGSLYSIKAYQNGVELETTYDSNLTKYDNFTSVQSGSTLAFNALFKVNNTSPITIEITQAFGDDKIANTFNLK